MNCALILLQIAVGFFAAVGVYLTARSVLDTVVMKKANASCTVVIKKSNDAEYAVRFAESRFIGEYGRFFDEITVRSDSESVRQLKSEFGNLNII